MQERLFLNFRRRLFDCLLLISRLPIPQDWSFSLQETLPLNNQYFTRSIYANVFKFSREKKCFAGESQIKLQGPVSRKSRKLFGPEKPFVKLRPAYSVKLVFSYVVKGIKIKTTAKFRASRRLRFEDTKRITSPEKRPKRFGTFEKQAPGPSCSNDG